MKATLSTQTDAPVIKKLAIKRFRGIERFEWRPTDGVNVMLGGGDVGKSTVLDAIALLLSPTNTVALSEADYWNRKSEDGFAIEAVMSLPERTGVSQQSKHAWPWEWDGNDPQLPIVDEGLGKVTASNPVYRLRVSGTPQFDLLYEILQPDGTTDHFSATVRRAIGLVRLGGDDRNDRDLRLVQGSALDRLLSDKALRARLQQKLAEADIEETLLDSGRSALAELNGVFSENGLPHGLGLGLVSGQGPSLNALIGLMAEKAGTDLPLASWGAGTRRLAALKIAAAHHGDNPVTLIDELERGLEPYRQRGLVAELRGGGSQVFLTTHSAATVSAAAAADIWYVDRTSQIGKLHRDVTHHLESDPEAFLSRITVFCEGITEKGFVEEMLAKAVGGDFLTHGIWVSDGGGNEHTLKALWALVGSGLKFSGFADDEGTYPDKWKQLREKLGPLLFRWSKGCLEENLIALVPDDRLEAFIADPEDELTGERRRTMADRLKVKESDFPSLRKVAPDFRKLVLEAATGHAPDGCDKEEKKILKKHAQRWFKSEKGGRELAHKMFEFGLWPKLADTLLPFVNAVLGGASLGPVETLPVRPPAAEKEAASGAAASA